MSGIISSIENLITSILGVFKSLFDTAFSALQSVVSLFTSAVSSVFSIFGTLLKDAGQLFEGLISFILANFMIIGLIVGGVFAYVVFQQRQGKPIAAGKKRA